MRDRPILTARDLTRRFGAFTAVDRVSFDILPGRSSGFLGSNGCGKTTTMKVLTGLLPPSEGEALRLFGAGRRGRHRGAPTGRLQCRRPFSLYAELTVRQNLALHARLFRLSPEARRARVAELVAQFDLARHVDQRAEGPAARHPAAPVPWRWPSSTGPNSSLSRRADLRVDPPARDRFWALLLDLARRQGVTIFRVDPLSWPRPNAATASR